MKLVLVAALLFVPVVLIAWSFGPPEERYKVKEVVRRRKRCPKRQWDSKRKACRVRLCPGESC